jgi:hypothetical protein
MSLALYSDFYSASNYDLAAAIAYAFYLYAIFGSGFGFCYSV